RFQQGPPAVQPGRLRNVTALALQATALAGPCDRLAEHGSLLCKEVCRRGPVFEAHQSPATRWCSDSLNPIVSYGTLPGDSSWDRAAILSASACSPRSRKLSARLAQHLRRSSRSGRSRLSLGVPSCRETASASKRRASATSACWRTSRVTLVSAPWLRQPSAY